MMILSMIPTRVSHETGTNALYLLSIPHLPDGILFLAPQSRHSRRSSNRMQVRIAPTLDSVIEQYHMEHKHHKGATNGNDDEDDDELNSTGARRVADSDDADDNSTLASQSVASVHGRYNPSLRVRVAPTLESVLSQNRHQSVPAELPPRGGRGTRYVPLQRPSSDPEENTRESEEMEESVAGSTSENGHLSTRAIRGPPDSDGGSSLATSVTSATATLTATTRGSTVGLVNLEGAEDRSHGTRSSSRTNEDDGHMTEPTGRTSTPRNVEMVFSGISTSPRRTDRTSGGGSARTPRSRSQSPLTVQESVAVESVASSVAPSIVSTAAVAPSRVFSSRRAMAAAQQAGGAMTTQSRPRVVSFVHPMEDGAAADDEHEDNDHDNLSALGADSVVSIPHSGVVVGSVALDIHSFANSARRWREEYEARLDSIQKQMSSE